MDNYLVDVPVLLSLFIRPEKLKKVFNVIKQAKPSTLFLLSDGPREDYDTDKKLIDECREIVEDINWECKVYKIYFDENQGLYLAFKKAFDYAFERVDRLIVLEDDVITSVSFFKYCEELLEKYKDDLRINMVCGMNPLGTYKEPDADYFFTKAWSIWGFAIWKRTYETFYEFSFREDKYTYKKIRSITKGQKSLLATQIEHFFNNDMINGHIQGPEFELSFNVTAKNQINIVPKYNMVKNIGYGEDSTHAKGELNAKPKAISDLFNMKTYEIDTPLKHPKFVIDDIEYADTILKTYGKKGKVRTFLFRVEGFIRKLKHGNALKIIGNKLFSKRK